MAEQDLQSPFQGMNRTVSFPHVAKTAQAHDMIFDASETEDKTGDPLLNQMQLVLANKKADREWQAYKETYLQAGVEVSEFVQDYSNGNKSIVRKVPGGTTTGLAVWLDGDISGECQVVGFEYVLTGDTGNRSGIGKDSLGDTPLQMTAVSSVGIKTISSALIYSALSDVLAGTASIESDITWGAAGVDDGTIGSQIWASVI